MPKDAPCQICGSDEYAHNVGQQNVSADKENAEKRKHCDNIIDVTFPLLGIKATNMWAVFLRGNDNIF